MKKKANGTKVNRFGREMNVEDIYSCGCDKEFVDDIVFRGLTKEEAVKKHFPKVVDKGEHSLCTLAKMKLKKQKNRDYYERITGGKKIGEDGEIEESSDISWTQEENIYHLKRALAYCENELYDKGTKLNVALTNMLVQSIDKMNMSKGYYEKGASKITIENMTITGFEGFKKYNDSGDIVEGDFKEVEEVKGIENNGE